jgi:hypothetical protein
MEMNWDSGKGRSSIGDGDVCVRPVNLGWVEHKLTDKQMDYVWKCIDEKKEDKRAHLAGHISQSNRLLDRNDWFYFNTMKPLIKKYIGEFGDQSDVWIPTPNTPLYMNSWWVNYQKEHEFNPLHTHGGIYSFVIFMNIPYFWTEQNKNEISSKSNSSRISNFEFQFPDILGRVKHYPYKLCPKDNGLMLLFPAKLAHVVYPFYHCKEDRITVSGNITYNTNKR